MARKPDDQQLGHQLDEQDTIDPLSGDDQEAAVANARALASLRAMIDAAGEPFVEDKGRGGSENESGDELAERAERTPLRIVTAADDENADLLELFSLDVKDHRPRGGNRFVRFMSAFADAVDRDIRLTLDA